MLVLTDAPRDITSPPSPRLILLPLNTKSPLTVKVLDISILLAYIVGTLALVPIVNTSIDALAETVRLFKLSVAIVAL